MTATKRAQILDDQQLRDCLRAVSESETPERDAVILLLSFKAGLRSQEIAGLDWEDVCDARGKVGRLIPGVNAKGQAEMLPALFVPSDIAKKGRERAVSLHPDLQRALERLKRVSDRVGAKDPVITGMDGRRLSANSVAQWFLRRFRKFGYRGASSHSGRRTFITKAAQLARESTGVSLRDVQLLAGHRFISTTEDYIEPSSSVHSLVSRL